MKKTDSPVKTEEPKPKTMSTIFLHWKVTVEECENIILTLQKKGFTAIYDAKAKVIKTTATKREIRKLFKKSTKGIQAY